MVIKIITRNIIVMIKSTKCITLYIQHLEIKRIFKYNDMPCKDKLFF